MLWGIVVHGGAGATSPAARKGCRTAAEMSAEILRHGGYVLEAVVEAVRLMEETGDFNAGVGSVLRFDGETIQADAVVATSDGREGAIEVVEDLRNPVLLARAVMDTPHLKLAGPGATEFARRLGLEKHPGPSQFARRRHARLMKAVREGNLDVVAPGWTQELIEMLLGARQENGDGAHVLPVSTEVCDTVGAVALDRSGTFALAASTGGMSIMMPGRVGDVPVRGAGFQIGPLGAVLATGIGEIIIRLRGADGVYRHLEKGFSPQQACEQVVSLFEPHIPVGFIALTRDGVGIASNRDMPSHSIVEQ